MLVIFSFSNDEMEYILFEKDFILIVLLTGERGYIGIAFFTLVAVIYSRKPVSSIIYLE